MLFRLWMIVIFHFECIIILDDNSIYEKRRISEISLLTKKWEAERNQSFDGKILIYFFMFCFVK